MKNFIKTILRYINSINNRNIQDLKEISTNIISDLIRKNEHKLKRNSLDVEKIFSLIQDLKGTSFVESLKIIESIILTIDLDGDICEFGVAQGKTSKLISYLIKDTSKKIYLYDSFEGLPKPTKKDILKNDIFNLGKMESYEGKMSHNEKKVLNELKIINFDIKKVEVNKGFFNKDNLKTFNFPKAIAFAYIDFDFYQPTVDVLNVINDKMIKDSIFIVDDYDFFSTGAKTALDEWYTKNKERYTLEVIKTTNSSFAIIKKVI